MADIKLQDLAVYNVLKKYGESALAEMITRLKGFGKQDTGKLIKSLKYDIQENMNGLELYFSYLDYGDYVDQGVNGISKVVNSKSPFKYKNKKPPISVLQAWCKRKGIPKGKAWRIQANIFLFGIAPTFWYTTTTTRRSKQLENDLEKALQQDFDDQIDKELNG